MSDGLDSFRNYCPVLSELVYAAVNMYQLLMFFLRLFAKARYSIILEQNLSMRILQAAIAAILIVCLFITQVTLTSCKKDRVLYDTVTVIKKDTLTVTDTVVIKDTTLTAEILTANQWEYQVFRGVFGGDSIVYYRGGTNNTANYDGDYIEFYTDGTGFSQDANGYSHLIKNWQFINPEHTKMTFEYYVTNSPIFHFVTWDNIRYKNTSLMFDEYYYDNYALKSLHDQTVRIPKGH